MAFARLVTHYWRHTAWLEDGTLLRDVSNLAGIPGVLVQGRLDVSSPMDIAYELAQEWRRSELVLIDDAGHGFGRARLAETLVAATDLATRCINQVR
jgi:proline iminopeptidase